MKKLFRNLAYGVALLGPLMLLVYIPNVILETGQGSELLTNVSVVRPVAFLALVGVPYLFTMFYGASQMVLRAVPRLQFSAGLSSWLTRERTLVSSGIGALATLLALLPFYTYQRADAIANAFNHGFVDRWLYKAGVLLIFLACFMPLSQRLTKSNPRKGHRLRTYGSRALYLACVYFLYFMSGDGVIPGDKIATAAAIASFVIAALVVSLMLPSASDVLHDIGTCGDASGPQTSAAHGPTMNLHLAIAVAVLLVFGIFPSAAGLWLGSLLIFIAGIGAWAVLLCFAWSLLLRHRSRFAVGVLAISIMAFAALYTDHRPKSDDVNTLAALRGSTKAKAATMVAVSEDFKSWNSSHASSPVIIVLAEGGGIRGAYWTADALATLGSPRVNLLDRTYAVIGVSGGALGAAAYSANYAAIQGINETDPEAFKGIPNFSGMAGNWAEGALTSDFIGPWLARVMSTEVPQKLIPWRFAPSKGDTLQDSWSKALACQSESFRSYRSNPIKEMCGRVRSILAAPLADFPKTVNDHPFPRLVFVSTHVETGDRILFSSVNYDGSAFSNAVTMESISPSSVDMISAVHASARFPLVSPPGSIYNRKGQSIGHVVDGGYVDASGAQTALEIVRSIESKNTNFRPIIIDLNNDPDDKPNELLSGSKEHNVGEFETIFAAVGSANQNRRYFAKRQLLDEVCHLNGGYISLKVDKQNDGPIGLGWTLSRDAASILGKAMHRESKQFVSDRTGAPSSDESMEMLETKSAESCKAGAQPF
ncbi:patatin-like phospholipase family protein [Paraburkholderia pallida]|uniref:PNPLA domain-containing protein n=1 Tax=Paraburkholderia pallida TaxID=2547399 RepID=A0A4P7D3D5_9BURK|nr:patatin-like phospholipase family protein [Paraburkholderia pallida]QBR02468.1 hypothetical protein E1956_35040 [Paraburkholderia pallida]